MKSGSLKTMIGATVGSAVMLIGILAGKSAEAAMTRLSSYSFRAVHRSANEIVIDTSGNARINIRFVKPDVARIRVSLDGAFSTNPSPAIVERDQPAVAPQIIDRPESLTIRTTGLSLHVAKKALRIDAFTADDKYLLTGESATDGTSWDTETGAVHMARPLDAAEHIYGLGQDNANGGTLDRRGTVCDLWTGQQIRSGNVTADYPIPFYLSSGVGGRGFGVFVDNVWRLRFDIGKTNPNLISWSAPGGPIDYYIINGPSFKTVIDRYTALTGRPTMLPLWALGYWQSRCIYWNFEDMQKTQEHLRKDGIPLDVMVIDFNWPKVAQDFRWGDPWLASGKKPETWLSEFRAKGVRVVQSNSGPMIREDSENFQDGLKRGLFASDGKGKTVPAGYYSGRLMDFTAPGMNDWLWPQLSRLSKQGIAGWWLDLIEPEGEPAETVYQQGKSADIHNSFGLRVFRDYYGFQKSVEPAGRPVLLGRAGSAGVQRYGILWSGDINSDWATLRAHIPEVQNSGLSGLNWWTNDSGGFISGFYKNDRYGAHARLYERWMEFSCFLPITRAHKSGPSEPFEFGPAVEETSKKYIRLRYRLLPYLYTQAYEAHATGTPIVRSLVLEYQNDAKAADAKYEFLFGRDLLVAPVCVEDATSRQVYLPAGKWIGFEDRKAYSGGANVSVDAPYDRIPLFVRAGAILPMAPDMMHTGEKAWDPITLDIYPEGASSFTMYQDDGLTTAYESNAKTLTTFDCAETPGVAVKLSIDSTNHLFVPKSWIARFNLKSTPVSVWVNGRLIREGESGWQFDPATKVLTVPVVSGGQLRHQVDVRLK